MISKFLVSFLCGLVLLSGCAKTPVRKPEKSPSVTPRPIEEAPQVESSIIAGEIRPAVQDGTTIAETAPVSGEIDLINELGTESLSEKDSMTSVTLDPATVEKLVLMNGSGPLQICRDPQANTIAFTAEVISRAKGLDRARALASEVRVILDNTSPGRYRARLIEPHLLADEECDIDLKITLPADDSIDFDLDIQDSGGSIAIEGFKGNLSITSLRGSIEIYQVTGKVDISSGTGPCDVVGVEGSLKIRDGAEACRVSEITGPIEIWGREGALEVRYVTGDVLLIDGRDGATVQSIEGDVTLFGFDPAGCVIEGVSGSVVYKTGAP